MKKVLWTLATVGMLLGGCSATETQAAEEDATQRAEQTAALQAELYDTENATTISFSGGTATIEGSGADYTDGVLTISAGGTYVLEGSLSGGSITVAAGDADVRLLLDNFSVTSLDSPALHVESAGSLTVTADLGTSNALSTQAGTDAVSTAAVWSTVSLTVSGSGSLTICSQQGSGIVCEGDVLVTDAVLTISAAESGICSTGSVQSEDSIVSIQADGSGMLAETGDVILEGGYLTFHTGQQNMEAGGTVEVSDKTIMLNDGQKVEHGSTTEAQPVQSQSAPDSGGAPQP